MLYRLARLAAGRCDPEKCQFSTEKGQFGTEKGQFGTEKGQFSTEKCQFSTEKCHSRQELPDATGAAAGSRAGGPGRVFAPAFPSRVALCTARCISASHLHNLYSLYYPPFPTVYNAIYSASHLHTVYRLWFCGCAASCKPSA